MVDTITHSLNTAGHPNRTDTRIAVFALFILSEFADDIDEDAVIIEANICQII